MTDQRDKFRRELEKILMNYYEKGTEPNIGIEDLSEKIVQLYIQTANKDSAGDMPDVNFGQSLSNIMNDIIWQMNVDGTFSYISPSVKKLMGYEVEEVLGRSIFDFLVKDDHKKARRNIQARIKYQGTEFYEYRMYHKNGNEVFVEVSSNLVQDEDGEPKGFTGITRNITERKTGEMQLQKSQANLHFLSETLMEMLNFRYVHDIYKYVAARLYDHLGRTAYISIVDYHKHDLSWKMIAFEGLGSLAKKITRLAGFNPLKMEGKYNEKIHHLLKEGKLVSMPKDLHFLTDGKIPKKLAEQLENLLGVSSVHCISFKHGETLFGNITIFLTRKSPELDPQLVESFIAQISLFIQKIEVDNARIESEAKYLNLFLKSSDPMLILEDGVFIDCNDTTFRTLGYPDKEGVVGKRPHELSPEYQTDGMSSKEKADMMIQQAIRDGYHNFDWIHTGKNNKLMWFNVSLTLIHEKRQKRLHTIWRNITERKEMEIELKKNRDQLQGLFDHMASGFAFHKLIFTNNKPVDYIFLEVNNAFEKMTGLKRKEVIGKRVSEVIPGMENDESGWIRRYGQVALSGEPAEFEDFSVELDKWFHVNAYSPEKGYFATTFEDISFRKKAEQDLKNHQETLSRLVKERTAELEEKNKQLERMNELFVGREFRIKELKEKLKKISGEHGD